MDIQFVYKIGRYLISGGTASVTQLLVYVALTRLLEIQYLLASVGAFLCALAVSFTLHKFFTFKDTKRAGAARQFMIFTMVAVCNLGLNTILMFVQVDVLNWNDILAQIIAMGSIAASSYVIYQLVIFTPDKKDVGEVSEETTETVPTRT